MYKGYPWSKTQYYRRLKKSKELGCSIDEIPETRGRHNNHAKGPSHYRWNKGKLMDSEGYPLVRVGKEHPLANPNGYIREHELVLNACKGLKGYFYRSGNFVVHHVNNDKTDNRVENLELLDRQTHSRRHGQLKLKDTDVLKIRHLYAQGMLQKDIAKKFGVAFQTVSKIIRGEKRRNAPGILSSIDHRMKDKKGRFVGKKAAGRVLDGQVWSQFPEETIDQ